MLIELLIKIFIITKVLRPDGPYLFGGEKEAKAAKGVPTLESLLPRAAGEGPCLFGMISDRQLSRCKFGSRAALNPAAPLFIAHADKNPLPKFRAL